MRRFILPFKRRLIQIQVANDAFWLTTENYISKRVGITYTYIISYVDSHGYDGKKVKENRYSYLKYSATSL